MANFFPRWTNLLPLKIAVCALSVLAGVAVAFNYYATPKTLDAGYAPSQPIPFSHKIHADQVGLDCRYCHSFVDVSGASNIPAASVCWNCHQHVQKDSPKLAPLHRAMDKNYPGYDGQPIQWVRVHKLADFVYFNHSAHVNRGVSCQSCHGQVDQMEVVRQENPLSMSWCLDCHRAPETKIRPLEQVYNLKYDPAQFIAAHPELGVKTPDELGKKLKKQWQIKSKESCTTCHR